MPRSDSLFGCAGSSEGLPGHANQPIAFHIVVVHLLKLFFFDFEEYTQPTAWLFDSNTTLSPVRRDLGGSITQSGCQSPKEPLERSRLDRACIVGREERTAMNTGSPPG